MKISIITVCFNSGATIRDTIESVLAQTYPHIEHIIVDGASRDNTMNIVNEHRGRLGPVLSEKDNGIYDAMNKGIALATGDVIGILNSDDFYADNDVLSKVAACFQETGADSVFGDLVYVDSQDTSDIIRIWKSGPYRAGAFKKGWHPPHPSFFVKKSIYNQYGNFNLSFKIASDYEIMLRFLERYKITSVYLPLTIVTMRTGGASNRSFRNIWKANRESYRAFQINHIPVSRLIVFIKPLSKLLQYFR